MNFNWNVMSWFYHLCTFQKENTNLKGHDHGLLSLIILNLFVTILAFTLYFCFLHSIRHSITLILSWIDLSSQDLKNL